MREADLYAPVRGYFENLGHQVYAEVPAPHGGYIDLLAVRDQVSVAVELKPSFSRIAVRQAGRNKRFVWESYVAVPQAARIPPRRKASLKRHGAGLLRVGAAGIHLEMQARCQAPACTLHEAFGEHLRGELAAFYARALGGVPASERASACMQLVAKIEESLEARGGLANTAQILADTLAWNYCRSKRAGLGWILRHRFRNPAADLWALQTTRPPAEHELPSESLIRTHLPDTFACLLALRELPLTGDFVRLLKNGQLQRRARVVWAERHSVTETPQRELRAGPAVFFRWRCPPDFILPADILVIRLAA